MTLEAFAHHLPEKHQTESHYWDERSIWPGLWANVIDLLKVCAFEVCLEEILRLPAGCAQVIAMKINTSKLENVYFESLLF